MHLQRRGKENSFKIIEEYLRNYHFFKVGIENMKEQLEYIMPSCTAKFELVPDSFGTFKIGSTTEKYAIDRIESKRALDLYEDIARYELIVNSIDNALKELEEIELKFVELRYFQKKSIQAIAEELGYSEKHIFNLRNRVMTKLLISLKGLLVM